MKAVIRVKGIKVWAHHGVMPQERVVGNDFAVSVEVVYPPALKAVESDCVDDTLNYARIIEVVRERMAQPSGLLEHVAGRICNALRTEFPEIESGRIKIAKLVPPVPAEIDAAEFELDF